ncbi:hypothetical protein KIPB_001595 [Kipferlia bialata]|uniref:Centrosomal protein CEP104 Zn finger domain-containing protein n=1 Tax=Kipferlia bialata TaxID=797122 RepID=A0A9K3CQJ8_9EUKA|nr:hypothetical protein KIPB_001595 [Kipferlia bialata]|eukprot:g1595.t1
MIVTLNIKKTEAAENEEYLKADIYKAAVTNLRALTDTLEELEIRKRKAAQAEMYRAAHDMNLEIKEIQTILDMDDETLLHTLAPEMATVMPPKPKPVVQPVAPAMPAPQANEVASLPMSPGQGGAGYAPLPQDPGSVGGPGPSMVTPAPPKVVPPPPIVSDGGLNPFGQPITQEEMQMGDSRPIKPTGMAAFALSEEDKLQIAEEHRLRAEQKKRELKELARQRRAALKAAQGGGPLGVLPPTPQPAVPSMTQPPRQMVAKPQPAHPEARPEPDVMNDGEEEGGFPVGMCHFCLYQSKDESDLRRHLLVDCPCLCCCPACERVVETPCLPEHMVAECAANQDPNTPVHFDLCPKCRQMIPDILVQDHVSNCTVVLTDIQVMCPLCNELLKDGEDALTHYTEGRGCRANPRTNPELLQR